MYPAKLLGHKDTNPAVVLTIPFSLHDGHSSPQDINGMHVGVFSEKTNLVPSNLKHLAIPPSQIGSKPNASSGQFATKPGVTIKLSLESHLTHAVPEPPELVVEVVLPQKLFMALLQQEFLRLILDSQRFILLEEVQQLTKLLIANG